MMGRGIFSVLLMFMMAGCGRIVREEEAAVRSPGEVLRMLKERDRGLENMELKYTVTGVQEFTPDWRTAKAKAEAGPESLFVIYHETMVVRGQEVTVTRELDKAVKATASGRSMGPYEKWSNARGMERNFSKISESGRGCAIYKVSEAKSDWAMQEYRAKVAYSLGVGFGDRITGIDSVQGNGDGLIVRGKIRLWTSDKSTFEIELDKDLIVRRAKLETDLENTVAVYEIETTGMVQEGGMMIAKRGTFRTSTLWKSTNGAPSGERLNRLDRELTCEGLRLNLAGDEYAKALEMPLPVGTQVEDRVSGRRYFVGEGGKEER